MDDDLIWLVLWNMAFMTFHILGIVTPTDSYFSEGLKPPTSYKWRFHNAKIIGRLWEDA